MIKHLPVNKIPGRIIQMNTDTDKVAMLQQFLDSIHFLED